MAHWFVALVATVIVVMISIAFARHAPAAAQTPITTIMRAITQFTRRVTHTAAPAAAAVPSQQSAASADDSRVHSNSGGGAPVVSTVSSGPDPDGLIRRPRPSSIPDTVQPYRHTPLFTESTIPKGLLRDHSTRDAVWGLIHVQEGKLNYHVTDTRRPPSTTLLSADTPAGLIEPTILHYVEPLGPVKFFVEFNREQTTTNP